MKSVNLFFIGALLMLLCSCSEKNQILDEPTSGRAHITIVTQVGKAVSASTRSGVQKVLDANHFTLYAFRKSVNNELYSFQEVVEKGNAITDGKWQYEASLPVGVYKFIAFYNLDAINKNQMDAVIKELKDIEWSALLQKIVIVHQATNNVAEADMNEIFYFKSGKETVNVSNGTTEGANDVKIHLTLKRLTSRIDVKFIKVATNKSTEVPYTSPECIFGAKDNLESLRLNLSGAARLYALDGTNGDNSVIGCNKLYETLTSLLMYGEATAVEVKEPNYVPFPTKDAINSDKMNDLLKKGISDGGAYFMGSYLLPFSNSKLSAAITLNGKNKAERIVNVGNLESKMNYVTVVTIKLLSSTNPNDNDKGDDNENLFNPKATFTVDVDYEYDGIIENEIEVE